MQFFSVLKNKLYRFYIDNSQSLLKGVQRPCYLAVCVLVFEYVMYVSLILTPSLIDKQISKDSFATSLKYVSIHMIPDSQCDKIVLAFLGLNSIILLQLVMQVLLYLIKSFSQKQSFLIGVVIMNYNSLLAIPSFILSLRFFDYSSIVNLIFTFTLSQICTFHSSHCYNYIPNDYLAKIGNIWDSMKSIIFIFSFALLQWIGQQHYYFFTIIYSLLNSLDVISFNFYHSQFITQLFLSVNISLFAISFLALISMLTNYNYSIVLPLICCIGLCFKMGFAIIQRIHEGKINSILRVLSDSHTETSLSGKTDKLIDYYTRFLMENVNFGSKKSNLFYQIFKQSILFTSQTFTPSKLQEEIQSPLTNMINNAEEQKPQEQTSKNEISQFIENEDKRALISLKNQIRQLQQKLDDLKVLSQLIGRYDKDKSNCSISQLFYLLEVEQNFQKLAIKLQEFTTQNKLKVDLTEISLVSQIRSKLQEIDAANLKNKIRLESIFQFEEGIEKSSQQLLDTLKLKQSFLQKISRDNFDLNEILNQGSLFLQDRKEVSLQLTKLKQMNENNPELKYLTYLYQKNLQIDPDDRKQLRHQKENIGIFSIKQMIKKQFNIQEIQRQSLLVQISLQNSNFGNIQKVSKNCYKLVGYDKLDLVGKNCNILIPSSIGIHHNSIIKDSIEKGVFNNLQSKSVPLIARMKDGFGVKIETQFQMQGIQNQNDQLGLINRILIKNDIYSKFILINIFKQKGQKIDIISKPIFIEFFSKYFSTPDEIKGIQIHQLIPSLSNLTDYMKKNKQQKITFQSLIFIPNQERFVGENKKRYQDTCQEIKKTSQKHYFNFEFNNVYIADFTVKYYQRDLCYEVIFLKLKNISRIEKNHFEVLLESLLIPQWLQFGQIKETDAEQIIDNLNDIGDVRVKNTSDWSETNDQRSNLQYLVKDNQNGMKQNYKTSKSYFNSFHKKKENDVEQSQNLDLQTTDRAELINQNNYTQNSPLINGDSIFSPKQFNENLHDGYISANVSARVSQDFSLLDKHQATRDKRATTIQMSQMHTIEELHVDFIRDDKQTLKQEMSGLQQTSKIESILENLKPQQVKQQNYTKSNEGTDYYNSIEMDENNNNNNVPVDQRTQNNSTSSKNSQVSQLKNVVIQKVMSQKSRKTISLILGYITISFICIIMTVIITYGILNSQISHQQLSFKYSSWQDEFLNLLVKSLTDKGLLTNISLRRYSFIQKLNVTQYQMMLLGRIQRTYDQQLDYYMQITREDENKVFVLKQLLNTQLNFTFMQPTFTLKMSQNFTLYDFLIFISYSTPQTTIRADRYALIFELEMFSNAQQVTEALANISSDQGQSEEDLNEEIILSVERTLILVILITSLMALIVIPFYSYFQGKQEVILRYFATLEPESLIKMQDELGTSLSNMIRKYKDNNSVQNKLEKNIQLQFQNQIVYKTKKHVSTTSLPRLNITLCIFAFVILIIISTQPTINFILTKIQIDQTKTQQGFIRSVLQLKSSMYYLQLGVNLFTAKVAFEYSTLMPLDALAQNVVAPLVQLKNISSQFVDQVYNLKSNSIITDESVQSTISSILTDNACDQLNDSSDEQFNYNDCISVFGGIFQQGLISGYTTYIQRMDALSEIAPKVKDPKLFNLVDQFYSQTSPIEVDKYFMIVEAIALKLNTLIESQKQKFFDRVDLTQNSLFIFEVVLLFILFPTVVVPFFNYTKNRMITVIQMFSIIQISYILENSYITGFIKKY